MGARLHPRNPDRQVSGCKFAGRPWGAPSKREDGGDRLELNSGLQFKRADPGFPKGGLGGKAGQGCIVSDRIRCFEAERYVPR